MFKYFMKKDSIKEEEDIWEAFMKFGDFDDNMDLEEVRKYKTLSDYIEESKPIIQKTEIQVYKKPETYFEYISTKVYNIYMSIANFFYD